MRQSIESVAEAVRSEYEVYFEGDLTALNDTCHTMSQKLFDALVDAGYSPSRVVGQYLGADDDFEPNTLEWEQEDIDNFDRDSGFSHWWIEVDGKIVDVCVDQFHPSDRAAYRIVVMDLPAADYERQVDQPEVETQRG